jgi:hypothetical protein
MSYSDRKRAARALSIFLTVAVVTVPLPGLAAEAGPLAAGGAAGVKQAQSEGVASETLWLVGGGAAIGLGLLLAVGKSNGGGSLIIAPATNNTGGNGSGGGSGANGASGGGGSSGANGGLGTSTDSGNGGSSEGPRGGGSQSGAGFSDAGFVNIINSGGSFSITTGTTTTTTTATGTH